MCNGHLRVCATAYACMIDDQNESKPRTVERRTFLPSGSSSSSSTGGHICAIAVFLLLLLTNYNFSSLSKEWSLGLLTGRLVSNRTTNGLWGREFSDSFGAFGKSFCCCFHRRTRLDWNSLCVRFCYLIFCWTEGCCPIVWSSGINTKMVWHIVIAQLSDGWVGIHKWK